MLADPRADTAAQSQPSSTVPKRPAPTREADASSANTSLSKRSRVGCVDLASAAPIQCPYLDTIDRYRLDFDFEKVCSVSLSNLNVYACLVCGRYFQGRGPTSHAYFHSMDEDHHVFLNLLTLKFYCLPDNYEVVDLALDDIKCVVNPTFTHSQIQTLDSDLMARIDLSKKKYLPGYVGLNNIKANDYMNVVIHSLAHVRPIRNFFLLNKGLETKSELVKHFGLLVRKMWHSRAFKGHISPHEVLQEIVARSKKKFSITEQGDANEFLSWLLNTLHQDLGGPKSPTVISSTFQGVIEVTSRRVEERRQESGRGHTLGPPISKRLPFFFLSLDLPPMPLFTDEFDKKFIPQVPLASLLTKFDGVTTQDVHNEIRTYKLIDLPPFLIYSFKRFGKNNFIVEKNHTVVNFPLRGMELMTYPKSNTDKCFGHAYDLVTNIVHEGKARPGEGTYSVHLRRSQDQWYYVQDLTVEEALPQTLFLSEAFIQIWERQTTSGSSQPK